MLPLVNPAVVMPRADAGVGLPRLRQDVVRLAAFDVINQRAALHFLQPFAVHHGFGAAVPVEARVVEMRGEISRPTSSVTP
jgi:hypothetical protein